MYVHTPHFFCTTLHVTNFNGHTTEGSSIVAVSSSSSFVESIASPYTFHANNDHTNRIAAPIPTALGTTTLSYNITHVECASSMYGLNSKPHDKDEFEFELN